MYKQLNALYDNLVFGSFQMVWWFHDAFANACRSKVLTWEYYSLVMHIMQKLYCYLFSKRILSIKGQSKVLTVFWEVLSNTRKKDSSTPPLTFLMLIKFIFVSRIWCVGLGGLDLMSWIGCIEFDEFGWVGWVGFGLMSQVGWVGLGEFDWVSLVGWDRLDEFGWVSWVWVLCLGSQSWRKRTPIIFEKRGGLFSSTFE